MLRTTWVSIKEVASISLTGLSPSAARFPNTIQLWMHFVTPPKNCSPPLMDPATPNAQRLQAWHAFGLGFTPFAHHYLGYLLRFLFLRVLRCFTSPGCRLLDRLTGCPVKVAPFRDPRITGCLLLPAAFRSLLRLSSASGAKAFPACPLYLNLINPLLTFFIIKKGVMVRKKPMPKQHNGGDDRSRTDDLLRARQALSH